MNYENLKKLLFSKNELIKLLKKSAKNFNKIIFFSQYQKCSFQCFH